MLKHLSSSFRGNSIFCKNKLPDIALANCQLIRGRLLGREVRVRSADRSPPLPARLRADAVWLGSVFRVSAAGRPHSSQLSLAVCSAGSARIHTARRSQSCSRWWLRGCDSSTLRSCYPWRRTTASTSSIHSAGGYCDFKCMRLLVGQYGRQDHLPPAPGRARFPRDVDWAEHTTNLTSLPLYTASPRSGVRP